LTFESARSLRNSANATTFRETGSPKLNGSCKMLFPLPVAVFPPPALLCRPHFHTRHGFTTGPLLRESLLSKLCSKRICHPPSTNRRSFPCAQRPQKQTDLHSGLLLLYHEPFRFAVAFQNPTDLPPLQFISIHGTRGTIHSYFNPASPLMFSQTPFFCGSPSAFLSALSRHVRAPRSRFLAKSPPKHAFPRSAICPPNALQPHYLRSCRRILCRARDAVLIF